MSFFKRLFAELVLDIVPTRRPGQQETPKAALQWEAGKSINTIFKEVEVLRKMGFYGGGVSKEAHRLLKAIDRR